MRARAYSRTTTLNLFLSPRNLNNCSSRWFLWSDYMSENAEKVLQAMIDAGKPVRPGEVAKAMGIESKEVSKAIKVLKKEGKIHSPKRCFYAPKE